MARVLVVGAPGRARELDSSGHVVEEADGVDPERLVTVTPWLEGISVLCWLFGDDARAELHGDRLESLVEYLVDTPVRGVVYERSAAHPGGEAIVGRASGTFRMPCAVVSPGDDLALAVGRVLGDT
ncbi:MAG TPA: hypothetical protein VD790_10115 [Thermoleophilaceae bacterium]|nr:hypothetical protein [Thermoleophilaceae bacterium]